MRVDTLLSEIKTAWSATYTADHVYDFPPQVISTPAVAIVLESVEFDKSYGGSADAMVRIQVFQSPASLEDVEYASMGQLVDDASGGFKQVIEGGTYTQGVSVRVVGLSDIGMTSIGGADYFTFSLMVEAID